MKITRKQAEELHEWLNKSDVMLCRYFDLEQKTFLLDLEEKVNKIKEETEGKKRPDIELEKYAALKELDDAIRVMQEEFNKKHDAEIKKNGGKFTESQHRQYAAIFEDAKKKYPEGTKQAEEVQNYIVNELSQEKVELAVEVIDAVTFFTPFEHKSFPFLFKKITFDIN